jgi:hypothetical protein
MPEFLSIVPRAFSLQGAPHPICDLFAVIRIPDTPTSPLNDVRENRAWVGKFITVIRM